MSLGKLTPSSSADDWDRKWVDIFAHYQNDIRHAHYIHALLESDEKEILEIAAGSFRDIAALNRWGRTGSGIDFSEEAVRLARKRYPKYASRFHHMSGFNMSFSDDSFDITYHNGFWGYSLSNRELVELATEQARVTRQRMIVTVHNARNRQFVEYFDRMRESDLLYDIRFFDVEEITELMNVVCSDVQVIPVGKQKKRWEDWLIKKGCSHPLLLRSCLKWQGHAFLDSSERLLCIGTPR